GVGRRIIPKPESIDEAAAVTQAFVQGQLTTTKLHMDDEQLDIRVQLPRVDRTDEDDIRAIQVGRIDGIPVRLSSVARVEARTGPAEIRRIEGQRGIRIHARLASVDLAAARNQVEEVLRGAPQDTGVTYELAGQAKDLDESLQSMMFAALLAVFLVYVVMASTFESLHHPLLIMCTVPLAVVGVVAALAVTGLTISAMVGIGVIILGGIVVNNAIVLVSAINLRRGRAMETSAAILEGASTRVRPILMTTVTTVLGLTPMALGMGDGAALRQPLAIAVIGGLLSSTLLTLFVLPAVYRLFPGERQAAWADLNGDPGAVATDPHGTSEGIAGAPIEHP
ncbi:MAG: efflux RND transporter permease subunit, partial [Nannocystaceae bacterium]